MSPPLHLGDLEELNLLHLTTSVSVTPCSTKSCEDLVDQIAPSSLLSLDSDGCEFDGGAGSKLHGRTLGHDVFKPLTDIFSQILSSVSNSHFEQTKS